MTTPTTSAVPSQSPQDLLFNAEKLDEAVNSSALQYEDRFGTSRLTLAGATARISAVNTRGAWVTATAYQARDVVSNAGTWYIALDSHTSGATFAGDLTAHWRVYQGLIASDLAGSAGAELVGYGSQTLADRLNALPFITDFSGIVADGTDQTSVIVTWLGTLSSTQKALYVIPYNCIFDSSAVMAAMPTSVMFLDLSGLNGYANPGDTAKRVGILAKDAAEDDSAWCISSGHNAILQTNNYGTAGTTSAAERVQGIVFSAGMFSRGNRGYREMAELLLKKAEGNSYWEWNWNSMAPWGAVNANYERWAAGVAATSGVTYVLSNFALYVAASTGTTGATAPTHSSGTVSDGGVTWTFVRQAGQNVLSLDEFGRIRSNGGVANTDVLSLVQNNSDPATSCVVSVQAKAVAGSARFVQLVLNPTDGATPSVVDPQPVIRATAGAGLQVLKSDGSAVLATFTDDGGLAVPEYRSTHSVAADGDTTPSAQGVGTLYVSNTSATTITGFDDASDGQILKVVVTNANTSFAHSSTLTLQGSTNLTTPAAYSVITFQRVPAAISARWVEIARSIK